MLVRAGAIWPGTRPDGSQHLMRGVIIFGVERGLAAWARFYLEPVEDAGGDYNEVISRQLRNTP